MCLQAQECRNGAKADWPQARQAGTEDTPSPPLDGGEGRGEEGRWEPLSSVLSPLLRRGARKWRAGFQEALHHRGERAVERVFERVEQLTALRLFARHRRAVQRQVADFLRGEQALAHHAVHQRADRAVGPLGLFVQLLLNGRGGARFVLPDRLDDSPFGFSQFDGFLRHWLIV